ncbi:hypothetical protein TK45_10905 [Bowmanella sp. JS7-9]|nr:hypothetical protein TK45_10905 [Bowmanella sp. JS7-9]
MKKTLHAITIAKLGNSFTDLTRKKQCSKLRRQLFGNTNIRQHVINLPILQTQKSRVKPGFFS